MGMVRSLGIWLGLFEDENDRDGRDDRDDFAVPVRSRSVPRTPRSTDRDGYGRADRDRIDRTAGERNTRDRDPRERDREVRGRDLRLQTEPHDAPRKLREDDDFGDRDSRVRDLRAAREARADRLTDTDARLYDTRVPDPRVRPRSEQTGEHPTVRPLSRPTAGSTALSAPAHENLANAPEVNLRERAAATDDRLVRPLEITMLHPTNYGDARAIGEQFRDGHPVIMNLTEMPEADAKRLVDFAAGLAFAVRGSMERVTNRVFLITPPNVRVSEEEKRRLAETGRFGPS